MSILFRQVRSSANVTMSQSSTGGGAGGARVPSVTAGSAGYTTPNNTSVPATVSLKNRLIILICLLILLLFQT